MQNGSKSMNSINSTICWSVLFLITSHVHWIYRVSHFPGTKMNTIFFWSSIVEKDSANTGDTSKKNQRVDGRTATKHSMEIPKCFSFWPTSSYGIIISLVWILIILAISLINFIYSVSNNIPHFCYVLCENLVYFIPSYFTI